MITGVSQLPIGNALRLRVSPPVGAVAWRVLRKDSDTIDSMSDASALVAYEGSDLSFLDYTFLKNGQEVFYKAFYYDGLNWVASPSVRGTPEASYEDLSSDALTVLRDRIEAGLSVEVARNRLNAPDGYIQVLTAPPPVDSVRLPAVSVHLDSESPQERGIGEDIDGIGYDPISDELIDSEGWLAQVQITVCGWSLNPDERIELRKALRRIVIGNLPVFEAAGLSKIEFSQRDEDLIADEMGANIYQAMCSFSCLAPVSVGARSAKPEPLSFSIWSESDVANPHDKDDCSCW